MGVELDGSRLPFWRVTRSAQPRPTACPRPALQQVLAPPGAMSAIEVATGSPHLARQSPAERDHPASRWSDVRQGDSGRPDGCPWLRCPPSLRCRPRSTVMGAQHPRWREVVTVHRLLIPRLRVANAQNPHKQRRLFATITSSRTDRHNLKQGFRNEHDAIRDVNRGSTAQQNQGAW